jgi:hypothetical protein
MTKQTGLGARFAVGGFDLGGDIQTLGRIGGGVPNPIIATDITQLAQARMGSVLAADGLPTGLYDGAMEAVVYFDPAANASHSQFSALPTTSSLFTFGAGAAAGSVVANLVGKQIDRASAAPATWRRSTSARHRQAPTARRFTFTRSRSLVRRSRSRSKNRQTTPWAIHSPTRSAAASLPSAPRTAGSASKRPRRTSSNTCASWRPARSRLGPA